MQNGLFSGILYMTEEEDGSTSDTKELCINNLYTVLKEVHIADKTLDWYIRWILPGRWKELGRTVISSQQD